MERLGLMAALRKASVQFKDGEQNTTVGGKRVGEPILASLHYTVYASKILPNLWTFRWCV